MASAHTPGPWSYVPGNEHHGPYVTSDFGNTICDCYVLSEPHPVWSERPRAPVPFMAEMAEPNARLIAAAPEMLAALRIVADWLSQDDLSKSPLKAPTSRLAQAWASGRFGLAVETAIAKAEGRADG